jgi:hypothetical protein
VAESYKTKCCIIVDDGMQTYFAERLARDFGLVYYYFPHQSAFPVENEVRVGYGIKGVKRVLDYLDVIDEGDVWFFPDLGYASLQLDLIERGKKVFGSKRGERFETDRVWAKQKFAEKGLYLNKYEVVKGIQELREYLKPLKDQWVKLNNINRGNKESFHVDDYECVDMVLDDLMVNFGASKDKITFIVEEAFKKALEPGYDGYCIDGQWPSKALFGVEEKDKAYFGSIMKAESMPESVLKVNEAMTDDFKKLQHRNFISTEIRHQPGGKFIPLDICCRVGCPPGHLYSEMFDNVSEIIMKGADGECVEPEYQYKYGAQLMLHSEWVQDHSQLIKFPEKIKQFVKINNQCVMDGKTYSLPQLIKSQTVGAVLGLGNTIEEAKERCIESADQVKGYDMGVDKAALDDAIKHFKEARELQ